MFYNFLQSPEKQVKVIADDLENELAKEDMEEQMEDEDINDESESSSESGW